MMYDAIGCLIIFQMVSHIWRIILLCDPKLDFQSIMNSYLLLKPIYPWSPCLFLLLFQLLYLSLYILLKPDALFLSQTLWSSHDDCEDEQSLSILGWKRKFVSLLAGGSANIAPQSTSPLLSFQVFSLLSSPRLFPFFSFSIVL